MQGPEAKTIPAAVTTVAAVYVYFLIFAQFGFLEAVRAVLGEDRNVIGPIMAAMGLMGVAGSVLGAVFFSEKNFRRWLMAGFGICAAAAGASTGVRHPAGFLVVAGLTGLGTGLATVTLAGGLQRVVGRVRLGLAIGLGTGLAYAFCNLPGIFNAGAATQALIAILAAITGWFGGNRLVLHLPPEQKAGGEYSKPGVAAWVLIFTALVGLDSAVFYLIQHRPELIGAAWTGRSRLVLNSGVHLGVAVLAGWALDRGWLGRTVGLGAGSLLLACWLFTERQPAHIWPGLLYIAGVSAYSTALVYYPARGGRPGLAAAVYAVAGWGGSALGISLVARAAGLPPGLFAAAGLLILSGLLAQGLAGRRAT